MSDLISDGGMDPRHKLEEVQRRQSQETLKEKIAIVIDSWDNLDCPDSTRAIKRYMNDNEFYRKVNTMFIVVQQ